jgi:hypothetical protein
MTLEERLDRISEKLELSLAINASYDEQIGRLVEAGARLDQRIDALEAKIDVLTEKVNVVTGRTIQTMEAINRLANIDESHEDRIGDLEDKQ